MKTALQITEELIGDLILQKKGSEHMVNQLREWALSIVDTCAGNFECEMEYQVIDGLSTLQPVLVRGSILKVKKQL